MKADRKKTVTVIILIVLICVLVIPFLMNTYWALPEADDFAQYSAGSSTLSGALKEANRTYMEWNGCWSYNFFYFWVHPLKYYSPGSHSMGIAIGIQFVLFVLSVIGVVFCFSDKFLSKKDPAISLFFSLVILAMILNSHIFGEIFGWYVGTRYMGAIILELVCMLLEKRFMEHDDLIAGVLLAFTGFMACMIVNVAVVIGSVYLFFLYGKYRKDKLKIKALAGYMIPLLFCVAGGLAYVLSPGNYIRQKQIDSSGMHPVRGLIYTAADIGIYTADLCFNYIVVFGMLVCLLLAFWFTRKKIFKGEYISPLIPFLMTFAVNFLLVYPAALGYADIELSNRVMFTLYVNMIFGMMFSFLNLGVFLEKKFGHLVSGRELVYAVILLVMGFYCTAGDRAYVANIPYVKQILDYNKSVEFNNTWSEIFTEIMESEEDDVVIDGRGKNLKSDLLDYPEILEDPGFFANRGAARFFGKKSVSVIYGEE